MDGDCLGSVLPVQPASTSGALARDDRTVRRVGNLIPSKMWASFRHVQTAFPDMARDQAAGRPGSRPWRGLTGHLGKRCLETVAGRVYPDGADEETRATRGRAATTQTFSQKRFASIAENAHLAASAFPALVLNADFQPLSWYPLSVWSWQDTVRAMFLDRVSVLSHYDRVIRSPGQELRLPSVVALKQYVPQERRPPFTRFNLFLRDRFTCQYCGITAPTQELTFDHVVPRSRGGRTSWDNITTACTRCNLRKGSRLPHECGMHPMTRPQQPTTFQLRRNGRQFPPNYLHESWRDFLYWDSELEP